MKRNAYYDYIENHLHIHAQRIIDGGKLNMLHLHMHSENFYLYLFNLLYNYELENLNEKIQNIEAIDLIDHKNNIIIQISATNTKQKVESALTKDICKQYLNYNFKFVSIAKDATILRTYTYINPHSIKFTPSLDIYDIISILRNILSSDISKMKDIYILIKEELGGDIDIVKLDSNLATVINILANEKWDDSNKTESVNVFEISRKITHNDLNIAKNIVDEYSLFYEKVNTKYSEFDSLGANKSNSVLATIKREYIKLKGESNSDLIFLTIIERIKERVLESANYQEIPIDELELCIDILVVDAFIRCKIFENPNNYEYATS